MSAPQVVEVFTPSDFPTHTYVSRDDAELEERLQQALSTPGEVISVSGPSKSGKTVLIEKVVGSDNLISVTGAGVRSAEQLWDRVLDWMDVPATTSQSVAQGTQSSAQLGVGGEAGVPLVAKGKVTASGAIGSTRRNASTEGRARQGLIEVTREIADSDFVLFVDDFHYMGRDVQAEVAREMKDAAHNGVKICVASVPHRSDDVVRGNPELRGRVRAVDMDYWEPPQLERIGELGFSVLRLEVDESVIRGFAVEASGSPQLMQALCLQTCYSKRVTSGSNYGNTVSLEVTGEDYGRILLETTTRGDFSSLLRKLYSGPKSRGVERKEHAFADSSVGDVYRAVLLALASDPPSLSFNYESIIARVAGVCASDPPRPQSVMQACYQLSEMARAMYPDSRVIDWDADDSLLEIIDPYFLFYLRHSGFLDRVARLHT